MKDFKVCVKIIEEQKITVEFLESEIIGMKICDQTDHIIKSYEQKVHDLLREAGYYSYIESGTTDELLKCLVFLNNVSSHTKTIQKYIEETGDAYETYEQIYCK